MAKNYKHAFRLHSKKRTTCSVMLKTALFKTALFNVVQPTLFIVVNNIFSIVTPDCGSVQVLLTTMSSVCVFMRV